MLRQLQKVLLVLSIEVVHSLLLPQAITELQKHEWNKNQLQELTFQSDYSAVTSAKALRPFFTGWPPSRQRALSPHQSAWLRYWTLLSTKMARAGSPHQVRFLSFFRAFQSLHPQTDPVCQWENSAAPAAPRPQHAAASLVIWVSFQKKHCFFCLSGTWVHLEPQAKTKMKAARLFILAKKRVNFLFTSLQTLLQRKNA